MASKEHLTWFNKQLDALPDKTPAAGNPKACKPSVTRHHIRILDAGQEIAAQSADQIVPAFMARQLVLATLPHKNPGDVRSWTRRNGDLTLGIQPGWDHRENRSIGYPYGVIPRLLLFWIVGEAIRTGNPRLQLGNSLDSFMREVGLDPSTGGGKRGDAKRLREQMTRLFRAKISFDRTQQDGKKGRSEWLDMQVAPTGFLWWDDRKPQQPCLFGSWIELSPQFFEAICSAPVPVNMTALRALKGSAMALDLYAWVCLTAFVTTQTGQARFVSWELLMQQFGAAYASPTDFRRKAKAALRKIKTVYPGLKIGHAQGGIEILPGASAAVPVQAPRRKTVAGTDNGKSGG